MLYHDPYLKNHIFLSRLLQARPKVVVAMDPCGGADFLMRDIIFHSLEEMASQNAAVLIASQNLNELKIICDTIYMMNSNIPGEFRKLDKNNW